MNLATIPLLIAALLMLGSGGTPPDTVQILLSGQVALVGPTAGGPSDPGAVIVADASARIPDGVEVSGPVYVIGGELTVDGRVTGDVVQLAGTVVVGPSAEIGGELRQIAGTLEVDPGAEVVRRSSVDLASGSRDGPGSLVPLAVLTLLLALVGGLLARTRPRALGNVAEAITTHPVIVLTVGALLGVTAIAFVVYMAFTLVLLPLAFIALAVGAVALAIGTIGLGHALGRRMPGMTPTLATPLGVVVAMVVLHLVGLIPLIGSLVVIALLLAGLGATVLTYFGLARFEPVRLAE